MKEAAKNFSFVIPELLAGMALPGRLCSLEEDLEFLRNKDIQAVVTLIRMPLNKDFIAQYGMEYLHIPIEDFKAPTLNQIETFVAFVDDMVAQQKAVVVHCHAGIGRTGTMLACYLAKQGMQAQEAIREIRHLRPGSIETPSQEESVWIYASSIK